MEFIQLEDKNWTVDDVNFIELFNSNNTYIISDLSNTFYKIEGQDVYKFVETTSTYECIPEADVQFFDNNKEIMKLLQDRLSLGRSRYGHGVRIDDDTRTWGTKDDSWEEMMLEEALDGMIYSAASMLRLKKYRAQKRNEGSV